jgi:hypothetical protein
MGRGRRTNDHHSPRSPDHDHAKAVALLPVAAIRERVTVNAARIAEQGSWPSYIAFESLTDRVPAPGQLATGFDAGIGCALDLIPRAAQRLASQLHAAYTPAAVEQVRHETTHLSADDQTTWWLAACSVCEESAVSEERFSKQLREFATLAGDPGRRLDAARGELAAMRERYELRDGVPYTETDGGMQGAYIASGKPFATMYAADAGLWFLGTYQPSLGLESFLWSERTDAHGRALSGPVHGSRQFCKAASAEEYERALAVVKRHFQMD